MSSSPTTSSSVSSSPTTSPSVSASSSLSGSASASPYGVDVWYHHEEELGDYGAEAYDWYSYFFGVLELPNAYTLLNIPYYQGALLRVTIYGGTDLSVGTLIFGRVRNLGDTQWGAELGIIDYSTKETDVYGITSIIERAYAKTMSCDMFFEHSSLRSIYKFLGEVRATPCLWIGSDEDTWDATIIYGFYKDFSINLRDYGGCFCSLEIEGLI